MGWQGRLDAQRASRGRYLRVKHQTNEQTQEGDQYDKRLYSTAIANPCVPDPPTAQVARPVRPTQPTTAGITQDDRNPTPQPPNL